MLRTYTWCGAGVSGPCDAQDGYRMTATLHSDGPDSAKGTITSSTTIGQVGETISVTLDQSNDTIGVQLGNGPGASQFPYCGASSPPGTCGA